MLRIGTRIKGVGVGLALVGALAVGVGVGGATLGGAGAADSPGGPAPNGPAPNGPAPKPPSAEDQAKLRQQLEAFRACMKDHGVDLPKPPAADQGGPGAPRVPLGSGLRRGLPPGVDRDKLRAARDACKDKLPARPQLSAEDRAKLRQQLEAFRACMKDHGVDLPKPPAADQGGPGAPRGPGLGRGLPPGVDRDKLRAARDACKDKLPQHAGRPHLGPVGGFARPGGLSQPDRPAPPGDDPGLPGAGPQGAVTQS